MREYDLLFRGAQVIDGTGAPRFAGDVAVSGQWIALVENSSSRPAPARRVIDATDLVLCPGMIDIQSHSTCTLFDDGRCVSKISQGITTEIMGETWTPAPIGGGVTSPMGEHRGWPRFGQWLDAMVAHGVSPNVGSFLPAGNVRAYAMGMRLGSPTNAQRRLMHRVIAEAMEDGAFGLSCALIYPPDAYMSTEEIIDLCRMVARYGGTYITHLRSEGNKFLEAIEEAIHIAREADLSAEIYHLKASGQCNWPKMPKALARINAVRDGGMDLAANMYPYTATGTGLSTILPPWAAADGKLYDNLTDPNMRREIRDAVMHPTSDWEPQLSVTGASHVVPIGLHRPENARYVGRPLNEIAQTMNREPVDAAICLLISERQRVFTRYHKMDERNIDLQMREPWVAFATDAPALSPNNSNTPAHPRSYGTLPRILGNYVREQRVMTLEDAIGRNTGSVAAHLNLYDRGQLRRGAMADLVLLNPQTVRDRATFRSPHQLSEGIVGVWVNGCEVWNANGHTGATPGQAVRRSGVTTTAISPPPAAMVR